MEGGCLEFNSAKSCGTAFESIFHLESEIPERLRITEPLDGRCYLLDGEIRHWPGPVILRQILNERTSNILSTDYIF